MQRTHPPEICDHSTVPRRRSHKPAGIIRVIVWSVAIASSGALVSCSWPSSPDGVESEALPALKAAEATAQEFVADVLGDEVITTWDRRLEGDACSLICGECLLRRNSMTLGGEYGPADLDPIRLAALDRGWEVPPIIHAPGPGPEPSFTLWFLSVRRGDLRDISFSVQHPRQELKVSVDTGCYLPGR